MLNATFGQSGLTYGMVRYGGSLVQPYRWGAWKVKDHYQPPLEEKAPPVAIAQPVQEKPYDYDTAARLIRDLKRPQATPVMPRKPRYAANDDSEAFFMLMN